MGGKLSKKKKGCYGDHTDEAADEPSETPVEQKDGESDAKQGLNFDNTLKGEQPDSNGLQSEEKSKNELQVGEMVNHVKEAAEASKDQTKDSQLSPNSEDFKLAQTKDAASEIKKVNGEGTHSEPEVGSSVSAESKPEETQSAIVEKNDPEICSNNTPENKAKEASATIQSTNGASENHTKCTTNSDKNVSDADEPVSSIATENTCNALSVKEKDSICLNAVNPSVNSASSNPPTNVSRDSAPSALQESPNKKNNSDGDRIDGRPLKSSDEVHAIICENTSFEQSLNDSNTIDDHEQVTTAVSKSDILIKSTESHKDESYNCELLNTAQEAKSECLNTENECGVKQGTCTAPRKDISVTAGDDECVAQKHQEAPKDQTSSSSETKSDFDSVPNLEDSINLEGSLAPSKVETITETKIVNEATVVTESESITAQTEVISASVQKASWDPVEVEPTPEVVSTSVTLVQSTSEVEHPVTQMEVESAAESETCVTSVAEESTTEPEASGTPVEEVSLVESPSTKAPAINISSSEVELCTTPEKATSEVELEGTVATLASSSESKVATMEEASPGKIKVDEVLAEVASPSETEKDEIEVSSPKLADCIAQKEVVGLAEPEEASVQREAASPEEEGEGTEQAASLCQAEDNVAEMHKNSQDEMEDSVVKGEGTSARDIEAPMISEHRSSMINASAVEPDYPAEPEVPVMLVEREECVTTEDTPDMAKVEADATPVDTASSNSDAYKGLAEVVTIKDSDTCNAQEHQEEGQESTEEKYPEEPDSKMCPETLQGTEINVVNKKENEVQNATDLKIEGSSEYVIHNEVPQNSEVVLNGDS